MFQWLKRYLTKQNVTSALFTEAVTAGVAVNETAVLGLSTAYACIRVLAEHVANLDLFLYQRTDDDGREKAKQHPLWQVLVESPNSEMTPHSFKRAGMFSLLINGNWLCEIVRNGNGRVQSLWPIPATSVQMKRDNDNQLYYEVQGTRLNPENVFHVHLLSPDGLWGMSPLAVAKETFGHAIAVQKHGASYFANAARPSGILKNGGPPLSPQGEANVLQSFKVNQGAANTGRVVLLQNEWDWLPMTIPNDQSQFIESAQLSEKQICQIYGVPLVKVQELGRATWANFTEQQRAFIVDTLRSYLIAIEQEVTRKLILPSERQEYYAEFQIEQMLRGSLEEQMRVFVQGKQWGIYNTNEIRKMLNLPGIGKDGDTYTQPTYTAGLDIVNKGPNGTESNQNNTDA